MTRSISISPTVTPEIHGLIKDNMTPEAQENWRKNGGKHMRDVDPERWEKMVEECAARDAAYEKGRRDHHQEPHGMDARTNP